MSYHRVELNAMTSRQFIDLLEVKFAEHGVAKVVPDLAVIEAQSRRLLEQRLARDALADISEQILNQAANYVMPQDLMVSLRSQLEDNPCLAWDDALAELIDEVEL